MTEVVVVTTVTLSDVQSFSQINTNNIQSLSYHRPDALPIAGPSGQAMCKVKVSTIPRSKLPN